MTVARLVYVSQMASMLADVELQIILGQSLIRNRRLDVTGLLVISGHFFCQTLEGRTSAVEQVMQRVRCDPRHHHIRTLLTEITPRRKFATWSMRLVRRDDCSQGLAALHGQSTSTMQQDLAILYLFMTEQT